MQVLKFGGSSVGSAEAINQMVAIVSARIQKEKTIVVVSAMSGVTDQLIILAQTAAQGNEAYKTIIQNIEQKHLDAVRALVPIQEQSGTINLVKQLISELETHSESLFMLKEFSMRMQPYYSYLAIWRAHSLHSGAPYM
jgi:aspartokinase/homoserine dehydrogenase 1